MSKKMKIKLLPNGEIQMETIGVKGKKCLEYLEFVKNTFNAKVVNSNYTDEYYETEALSENSDLNNVEVHFD